MALNENRTHNSVIIGVRENLTTTMRCSCYSLYICIYMIFRSQACNYGNLAALSSISYEKEVNFDRNMFPLNLLVDQ